MKKTKTRKINNRKVTTKQKNILKSFFIYFVEISLLLIGIFSLYYLLSVKKFTVSHKFNLDKFLKQDIQIFQKKDAEFTQLIKMSNILSDLEYPFDDNFEMCIEMSELVLAFFQSSKMDYTKSQKTSMNHLKRVILSSYISESVLNILSLSYINKLLPMIQAKMNTDNLKTVIQNLIDQRFELFTLIKFRQNLVYKYLADKYFRKKDVFYKNVCLEEKTKQFVDQKLERALASFYSHIDSIKTELEDVDKTSVLSNGIESICKIFDSFELSENTEFYQSTLAVTAMDYHHKNLNHSSDYVLTSIKNEIDTKMIKVKDNKKQKKKDEMVFEYPNRNISNCSLKIQFIFFLLYLTPEDLKNETVRENYKYVMSVNTDDLHNKVYQVFSDYKYLLLKKAKKVSNRKEKNSTC